MAGAHVGLVPGDWPDDRTRPEEIQGKIKSLNTAEHVIALENGTKIWVGEGLSMGTLREGASVKASYEERDGKKVATSIEVK